MTEADQRRAAEIADALSEVLDDSSGLYPAGVAVIAAALAEEREKARAPFLALADAHERYAEEWNDEYPEAADVLMDSAARIRRAAEVTE